ncbi:hypothetical protein JCM11491_007159 [Sporobolomyces phaffii]
MIHTTSYLFDHLSPDGETLFITPYSPAIKRDATELNPIKVSDVAYFVRASSGPSSGEVTGYYLGRNSDASYNTFKFTLDADSPPLPQTLDHLFAPKRFDGAERPRTVEIVSNPASGHGYSNALLNDVVRPLLRPLEGNGSLRVRSWETQSSGDGERVGRELASEVGEDKAVIVFGGDGTVHEVLNGAIPRGETTGAKLDLILIPTGTANALYYHLFPPESSRYPVSTPHSPFYSLLAFLRTASASPTPLPLALNTIYRPPTSTLPQVPPILTSVVASAALHACLLHDAESLRSTHPGVERFKVAAQANVTKWWDGTLALPAQHARRYDPTTKTFVAPEAASEEGESGGKQGRGVELEGPFAYWVSSLTSRFESNFVVAPLRSPQHALAPSVGTKDGEDGATIDLIIIRPLRHLPTKAAYGHDRGRVETRTEFASKVWQVTGGMYDGGKHVDMMYPGGEGVDDLSNSDGERTEIVEVWRTDEFKWTPAPSKELKSNLVCLDGALHDLGEGGYLHTRVLGTRETGLRVWS